MRVMVMVKATRNSEAGMMPTEELLAAMGKFNEALVKAGIMTAGEGLHPSSRGKRVRFSGGKKTVRRDEGTRRRLLDLEGKVDGGGLRLGAPLPGPNPHP